MPRKRGFFKRETRRLVFEGEPYKRPIENQHSRLEARDVIKWMACNSHGIFYKCEVMYKGELSQFLCWEMFGNITGTIHQFGRDRINFQGGKCYSYQFSYIFFNPDVELKSGYEISHLCGNPKCWNPDHLCYEPAGINRSRERDICTGYIWNKDREELMIGCEHHPKCKRLRVVKNVN